MGILSSPGLSACLGAFNQRVRGIKEQSSSKDNYVDEWNENFQERKIGGQVNSVSHTHKHTHTHTNDIGLKAEKDF